MTQVKTDWRPTLKDVIGCVLALVEDKQHRVPRKVLSLPNKLKVIDNPRLGGCGLENLPERVGELFKLLKEESEFDFIPIQKLHAPLESLLSVDPNNKEAGYLLFQQEHDYDDDFENLFEPKERGFIFYLSEDMRYSKEIPEGWRRAESPYECLTCGYGEVGRGITDTKPLINLKDERLWQCANPCCQIQNTNPGEQFRSVQY